MAEIQRRGAYTPRRVRERRAYRTVQVGVGSAAVGVLGIVLAVAGVVGAWLPIVAFIVMLVCISRFRGITGQR